MLQFDGLEGATLPAKPLHLAIGIFDGVHRGHQSVIGSAIHSARHCGGMAGVLTFWPHPSAVCRPENPTRLLMPSAIKRTVLERWGLDFIIEQNFTPEFAGISAGEFVALLRRHLPHLDTIYVGENWRFGRDRAGDVTLLIEEGRKVGLAVYSAPRLLLGDAPISTSRIRELLARGSIEEANSLLGFAYFTEGVVVPGRQLGRTIGFPTLNVAWVPEFQPRHGVYAVEVAAAQGQALRGVANYGLRPTVGTATEPLLEVHLLDESKLDYGATITVRWLHFLRPEAKFSSLDELRAQIGRDRENARQSLAKRQANKISKDA